MNNAGPYGLDSMAFGNQDDYLNQFGYDDGGKISIDQLNSHDGDLSLDQTDIR